jgi:hypothetical protein
MFFLIKTSSYIFGYWLEFILELWIFSFSGNVFQVYGLCFLKLYYIVPNWFLSRMEIQIFTPENP